MIIYSTKTNKLPVSDDILYSSSNFFKLYCYDKNLLCCGKGFEYQKRFAKDVFNTYYSLVNFNNLLDVNVHNAFLELNIFIEDNPEIKNSVDFRCRSLYDEMEYWNNKYKLDSSSESVKQICDKVQKLLEQLEKQEIVKKSSCNLKKNYY